MSSNGRKLPTEHQLLFQWHTVTIAVDQRADELRRNPETRNGDALVRQQGGKLAELLMRFLGEDDE